MASKLYNYTAQEIQSLLDSSNSYADLLRKLGMSEHGANRTTLRKIIDEYGLDLTQINQNRKNEQATLSSSRKPKTPLGEILKSGTIYKSSTLLQRLCKEGYKEKRCEMCGITDWMGQELSFHLHHKDGDHHNNDIDNLQILCPNCHSQTENFAGKGISKTPKLSKENERKRAQRGISDDGQRFYDGYGNYKILCQSCGKNFMNVAASKCRECYKKERKVPKITKDELFAILKDNTLVSAAQLLNVDRDTVSRWRKYYIEEESEDKTIVDV